MDFSEYYQLANKCAFTNLLRLHSLCLAGLREWFAQTDEIHDVSKMPLMVDMTAQALPVKKDKGALVNYAQANSSLYLADAAGRPSIPDEDSDEDDYQVPEPEKEVGMLLLSSF